ncbi:MAG: hypothetical protein IPO54_06305 [Micavibrio sp.]|nr:hypothetical protein [Micavibrio sp.]
MAISSAFTNSFTFNFGRRYFAAVVLPEPFAPAKIISFTCAHVVNQWAGAYGFFLPYSKKDSIFEAKLIKPSAESAPFSKMTPHSLAFG